MDGVTAFFFAIILAATIGFSAGRYYPLADVKQECATKGEFIAQSTIIKCKPVAAMVDGKRIEFVEK